VPLLHPNVFLLIILFQSVLLLKGEQKEEIEKKSDSFVTDFQCLREKMFYTVLLHGDTESSPCQRVTVDESATVEQLLNAIGSDLKGLHSDPVVKEINQWSGQGRERQMGRYANGSSRKCCGEGENQRAQLLLLMTSSSERALEAKVRVLDIVNSWKSQGW
jgi:hypothetical protein